MPRLAKLIDSFSEYEVIFEADNGLDFQQKLVKDNLPDLVLLDINMTRMDGFTNGPMATARLSTGQNTGTFDV